MNTPTTVALTLTLCTGGLFAVQGAQRAPASPPDPWQPVAALLTPKHTSAPDASGWSALPSPLMAEPTEPPTEDLYGNQVSDAVATYKFDAEGSAYEEHSPQTDLPRLTAPTT